MFEKLLNRLGIFVKSEKGAFHASAAPNGHGIERLDDHLLKDIGLMRDQIDPPAPPLPFLRENTRFS